MEVPMADLKAQHQAIRQEIDEVIRRTIDNCAFILGPEANALEEGIAQYSDAKYGIGVGSGTDALILSLAALGIGHGDEVITTPFTFVATTEAIVLLGAKPVYSDIDPRTFNMDPSQIEEKITPRTKAILPVQLFGQSADIAGTTEVAEKHGLPVVWDGAQAIGTTINGKGIGAFGEAVTLSFYPAKNLGACGDAGMILTNDEDLMKKLKLVRFHGGGGPYSYKYVGYCSRLDGIQAAVLRVKLRYLDSWTAKRRENAEKYKALLADLDITLPYEAPGNDHTFYQFTIRTNRRDELANYLKSKGISTGVYYPGPLHLEEAYRYLGYAPGDFPVTELACKEVLSLPIYPEMADEQLAYVAAEVRSFFED